MWHVDGTAGEYDGGWASQRWHQLGDGRGRPEPDNLVGKPERARQSGQARLPCYRDGRVRQFFVSGGVGPWRIWDRHDVSGEFGRRSFLLACKQVDCGLAQNSTD
jgi:hypothetical protein